jgi:phosphatidylinositol alpha-1,6-mannosyltransferase
MKMVLALVTDAFGGRGGIAQYNRDFLSALASAGSKVVALPRHAPDAEKPADGIEQRPAKLAKLPYSWSVIVESLRLKPHIIFCGHVYMAPLGWIAAKLSGAKLVIQTHGIEAWPRPSRLERRACEQAAMILSVSRHTRARVLDWAVIPPERVLVVPNTVDDCYTPGDGSALRCEWQLEGKKVLLTVGRMRVTEQYKGHDRVIEALTSLIAAGHDVVYVIAGEGDDRSRLERFAQTAGVGERVRFVGALPRETLIEAYRMSDLFVMPSTGEGFGIAFLEAMACGTPALGFNIDGSRDALADGELGISANQNDLARAVSEALARPRPDPETLHHSVQVRFGHASFRSRIAVTFTELLKPA